MTNESLQQAPLPEEVPSSAMPPHEADESVTILHGDVRLTRQDSQNSAGGMGAGVEETLAEQSRARTAALKARREARNDSQAQQ